MVVLAHYINQGGLELEICLSARVLGLKVRGSTPCYTHFLMRGVLTCIEGGERLWVTSLDSTPTLGETTARGVGSKVRWHLIFD